MPGSVLFAIALGIVLVLILLGVGAPLFLVPVVIVVLGVFVLAAWFAKLRGSAIAQPDSAPQGVPGTREASYEPVRDPSEHSP
jgi:hypothetical protein